MTNDQEPREVWAARAANHIVDGALTAIERLPLSDQMSFLRALARRALLHMPNSGTEARTLARVMDIENLKQPHPKDDPPARD